MDGQCDELVTGDGLGRQFITLTIDICVQHGGPEALHCAGLSAAVEILCLCACCSLDAYHYFVLAVSRLQH